MFKKKLTGSYKKRFKVFSLFLVFSFLAWFLSNLSESYESRANFKLDYGNMPDTLLLGKNSASSMEIKIKTSGFRHFYLNLFNKKIKFDLSQVVYQNESYKLTEDVLKKQIERQLSQNILLVDLYRDELLVDLYRVASREIPITPITDIQFQQNYILDGKLMVTPKTVLVKGPPKEIDTLQQIFTSNIELNNITSDFSKEVSLVLPENMSNSIFSLKKASVNGSVVKFSEEMFEVPVKVVNLPEGYSIKTFPATISVVCKATLEQLKVMDSNDFEVLADYGTLVNPSDNVLFLQVTQKPEKSFGVRLQEDKVNFVLEQE